MLLGTTGLLSEDITFYCGFVSSQNAYPKGKKMISKGSLNFSLSNRVNLKIGDFTSVL